ncbi:CatB-related O-acetyltransferase [Francisella philomiragia]|uniref:CatB-related O-acetyltransferase n=1 Tax=Francisella philomiragia TaxID=28110 RepID=UPI00224447CA|nr:CatB-related O-acetyltransferase [Francisella philomiragia]
MKRILRNPLSIWFNRLLRAKKLEFKYRKSHLKIGYMTEVNNCSFGIYTTLYDEIFLKNVSIGDFTYVASKTHIHQTKIGKFCSIGPGCRIGLGKHPTSRFVSTHPAFFSMSKQSQVTFVDKNYFTEFENINIGNDVWIGANVLVVDGVNIGSGAIIAAGSVVTKDVPPYAVVGGVPAKVIKFRFEKDEVEKLLKVKWWDMDIEYFKKYYKKFLDVKKII